MAPVPLLLHTTWLLTASTDGTGSTVTEAVASAPGQPFADGVIVNVVVCAVSVALLMVPITLPLPDAVIPGVLAALVRTHVKDDPDTLLPKVMALMADPEQTVCDDGLTVITGSGFTVIVKVVGVPGQVLIIGVTVIVAITGAFPVTAGLNAAISPVPDAARPIAGVSFVQENVAPAVELVK